MLTGIYGAAATFSSRRISSRRGKKANSTSRDLTARRWPLWKCEPTRSQKGKVASPELSIGKAKHQVLVRTAHGFPRERHVKKCPVQFDVAAIDNTPGKPPVVRLHKDALSPRA